MLGLRGGQEKRKSKRLRVRVRVRVRVRARAREIERVRSRLLLAEAAGRDYQVGALLLACLLVYLFIEHLPP